MPASTRYVLSAAPEKMLSVLPLGGGWAKGDTSSTVTSSQELPDSLLSAVDMEKQRPLIMKVNMFKDVTPACIVAIIRALESEFAPPREYVIVQGQTGDCMYFINKGVVQLTRCTKREGEQPVMQLSDGHHFGEGAIVNNQKRSANALTLTHCYFQVRAAEKITPTPIMRAWRLNGAKNESFLVYLTCPAALPGFLRGDSQTVLRAC